MKPANKMKSKVKISHDGVGGAKGSSNLESCVEPDRTATQSVASRSPWPMRVHETAKRNRSQLFNNLLCHITPERLSQAYQHLNKQSAKGVDGESWKKKINVDRQCAKKLVRRLEVKALYSVRRSEPPKPRVMSRIG